MRCVHKPLLGWLDPAVVYQVPDHGDKELSETEQGSVERREQQHQHAAPKPEGCY